MLVNGILWQMFSKTDAETLNKVKAEDYLGQFLVDIDYVKRKEELYDNRFKTNSSMCAFL